MPGDPQALSTTDPAIPAPFRPVTRTRPPWCADCRHRSTAAFVGLTQDELAFMARFKRAHVIASAGERLAHQGSALEFAGVLYSGLAARYRTTPAGERLLLSLLLPGDLIGIETAAGTPPWFDLEALTDVSACLFDADQLHRLLAVPSLGARLIQRLASDRRHVEERFTAVAAADPRHSLAHFVVDLHHRLYLRGLAPEASLSLPLTRRQLAEAIGVTTVHLHRVVRELRQDGIMHFAGRKIVIADKKRLRALAVTRRLSEPQPLI